MAVKKIIIVLGMHRSGTSALAGELHHQSVWFGENFIEEIESVNKKGFYEHQDLVSINEQILTELDCKWYNCFWVYDKIRKGWRPSNEVKDRIRNFLTSKEFDRPVIGIKDPRLCLLYPIWHEEIKLLNWESKVILVNRNIEQVASSLYLRDNIVPTLSNLLWECYTICAAIECCSNNGVWVNACDLFNKPLERIREIYHHIEPEYKVDNAKFIDVSIPKNIMSCSRLESTLYNRIQSFSNPLHDINWKEEWISFRSFLEKNESYINDLASSFELLNEANNKAIDNGNKYLSSLKELDELSKRNSELINMNNIYLKRIRELESSPIIFVLSKIKQILK